MRVPELRQAIEQTGMTRENGFANFSMAISAPLPDDMDKSLAEGLNRPRVRGLASDSLMCPEY